MNSKLIGLFMATLTALALVSPLAAERGDDSNRKSKNGLAHGTIDGVDVTIEYGRPNVKGREVWGKLVPLGKIWRTGADEATTITVSADVTVEDQALPVGTYSLFTVPGETTWEIVFNKVAKQWGAFKYDPEQDALRVSVPSAPADFVESLTFEIDADSVVLRWAELAVPFTLAAAE
ncbi:MAG: DUF2911 domain-containing protein [Acidobacteriota bacterium]|nr:DUF2911 domain-containing protein [Acidobacteriota bacterium]